MDSDCSPTAGSIVWVRRRNGSWWPGKILGAEELPSAHLTSPRSGTPVKLLGREDASVDWYNLEKSKRVKAFRCGEFDDCIERAESAQGMPIKKREKYARREDAILHALELEKELLRKQGKVGVDSDRARSIPTGSVKTELETFSRNMEIDNGRPGDPKLSQLWKRVDSSEKDESISDPQCLQKPQDGNQPGCEDDHSDATPRMRGLQDLGLKTASLKRKPSTSDASDSSQKLTMNNNSQVQCNSSLSVGRPSQENGEEQVGGMCRAKRSRGVYLPTGSSDTSDGKEVPPSHIEMSSSQIEDGDSHHEENASELMEETESDFSRSESSESNSDSSKTELDMDEEMTDISGAPTFTETEVNAHGRYEALEPGNISTEDSDESAFSGDLPYPHDQLLANETVSKWQLKGKRNTRNLTKRSSFSQRAPGHSTSYLRNVDYNDGGNETGLNDRDFGTRIVGLDNGRFMYASREASSGRNCSYHDVIDWDDISLDNRHDLRGHWDPRFLGHDHFGVRAKSMLMDVDLQVQASYQKPCDPIISLTSKLDGKAIIGHSIKIGVLEDGSSETFLPVHDYFGNEVIDQDGNTALPPAWRTARRTSFRVPRPRPSSMFDGDDVDDNPFLDQERKPSFKRMDVGGFGQKTSLVRKSQPQSPRPPMDKRLSKKSRKRGSSSANQKTRTLSSISIEQNHSTKPMHHIRNCQMDGLIKPGLSGPTTVACIPVKLVFSRLLEKINRPPSKAASKVVLPHVNMERNLL